MFMAEDLSIMRACLGPVLAPRRCMMSPIVEHTRIDHNSPALLRGSIALKYLMGRK
jgi:hypothetical protein